MKRNDLQGIRGVAILFVLLFHLQPSTFPLGFVGVDMFFVLSGFLMTMILSKKPFSTSQLDDFFRRRFKRIVPLMYTILLFVYIGCSFLLIDLDKEDFKNDLRWSLSFTSNIQPIYEVKGYWDQISSYRFLVHCWSLGVEIQYYCIAPFIIAGTNCMTPMTRKFVLLLLIICSLGFQLISPPKWSYGFLASRIWQFLIGSLCFEPVQYRKATESEQERLLESGEIFTSQDEDDRKSSVRHSFAHHMGDCLFFFLCLAVIFNPKVILTEKIMRIFGTATTALLIKWPQSASKMLLLNRVLVYFGDISYVMYLIHWPMIVATKYVIDQQYLDAKITLILFVAIFIVSAVFHHTVEKFLLSCPFSFASITAAFCLAFIIFTFPYYDRCCKFEPAFDNSTIDMKEAMEFNTIESGKMYFNLPCSEDVTTAKWTNFTWEPELRCETKGNGTLKVMIIGNSMAYRAFPLIHKVFKGRYKELRLYAKSSTVPLADMFPEFGKATRTVVDKIRPDILWNIHVEIFPQLLSPFLDRNDSTFLEFQRNTDFYSKRTKLFVIDLPFYWSKIRVAYEMVKRFDQKKPVEDLKVPKTEAMKQQEEHVKRIKAIKCENCVYQDVEKNMYEGDMFYLYNRRNLHAYTSDGAHWTDDMLEKLTPLYKRTVEDLLLRLKNNN